jgi:hypothetical protein
VSDNLNLITPPTSILLATDEITHGGDASQAQVTTLYEVTGAEGSKVATPVVYSTQLGATNETSAAADNSTSGLNGLIKRLLARLTALFPAALGANGGLKVDIVGDTGTSSTLDTDDASVAGAQANIALTIPLRYTWNGSTWVRGGFTPHKLNSAATTNATSVKASAGVVGSICVTNINAAVRYLKLYNKASAPTVGSDVPVLVYAIPGATTGGGTNIPLPDVGLAFSTGIAYALTTGAPDADTGAVALNELIVNLGWL